MLISSLTAIVLPIIVATIAIIVYTRTVRHREKASPFECGFDPNHLARIPFSIRFFLLAIIFIVFDIEIVLLVPTPLLIYVSNSTSILIGAGTFLIILIIGLLHE